MPRVKPGSVKKEDRDKLLNEFWVSVSLLRSKEEIKNFFRDLLSESEALMLARRFEIAKLILEDKSYLEIREKLGAGFSTIGVVHSWLQGGFGGYKKLIDRLEKVKSSK